MVVDDATPEHRVSMLRLDIYQVGASGTRHIRTVSTTHGPPQLPPRSPLRWPPCECPRHTGSETEVAG